MTPEHKFELLRTAISILPATVLSIWALIHQRRQTMARLEVLLSPILSPTVDGKTVLGNEWPGVVVRNQSTFPLRVCNVGVRIGKKFYSFERPLLGRSLTLIEEWPLEVQPRSRLAFYPSSISLITLRDAMPELKGKKVWEVARAYAMTECNRVFFSRRLSRKSLKTLRDALPKPQVDTRTDG